MQIIPRFLLAASLMLSASTLCRAEITAQSFSPLVNVTDPPETYEIRVQYTSPDRLLALSLGDDDLIVGETTSPLETILIDYSMHGRYTNATYAIKEPTQGWQSLTEDGIPIRVAAGTIRDRSGNTITEQEIGSIPLYRPTADIGSYHGPTTIPANADSIAFSIRYQTESNGPIDSSRHPEVLLSQNDTVLNPTRVTDILGNKSYIALGDGYLGQDTLGNPLALGPNVVGIDWLGNFVTDPNKGSRDSVAEVVSANRLEDDPQTVEVDYLLTRPGDFWPVNHVGNLAWHVIGNEVVPTVGLPLIRPRDRITASIDDELPVLDPAASYADIVVIYENALSPIDVSTLDNRDIYYILELPTDPGAFYHYLEKVSESVAQEGHEIRVTYRAHRPEHGWPGGKGPRFLQMDPDAVRDQSGMGNGPQKLGPVTTWGFNPGIRARLLTINPPTEDTSVVRLRVEYHAEAEIQLDSVHENHLLLTPLFSSPLPVKGERELIYPRGWMPSGEEEMVWRPEALECPIQLPEGPGLHIDPLAAQGRPIWMSMSDWESIVLGLGQPMFPPGLFETQPVLTIEKREDGIFGPRYYPLPSEDSVLVPRMLEPTVSEDGRLLTVSYEFSRPEGGWSPEFEITTSAGLMTDAAGFHLEANNLFHQFGFGARGPAITGTFVSGDLIEDPAAETHQFQIRFTSTEASISEASLELASQEDSGVSVGSSRTADTPWRDFTNTDKVHPGQTSAPILEWELENNGQAALVTYEIDRPATGWDSWGETTLAVIVSSNALETTTRESTVYDEIAAIRLGFGLEHKPYQVAFEDWLDEFEDQLGLPPSDSLDADTDEDGASNAEEFIMGTDPLDASDSAALEVKPTQVDDELHLEVGVPLRRDFFGVRPELQGSYDGVDWFNVDADFELLGTTLLREGIHFLTLRTRQPISHSQSFFVRLGITSID